MFYFLTKYVQSRLLQNCCMWERVHELYMFSKIVCCWHAKMLKRHTCTISLSAYLPSAPSLLPSASNISMAKRIIENCRFGKKKSFPFSPSHILMQIENCFDHKNQLLFPDQFTWGGQLIAIGTNGPFSWEKVYGIFNKLWEVKSIKYLDMKSIQG